MAAASLICGKLFILIADLIKPGAVPAQGIHTDHCTGEAFAQPYALIAEVGHVVELVLYLAARRSVALSPADAG